MSISTPIIFTLAILFTVSHGTMFQFFLDKEICFYREVRFNDTLIIEFAPIMGPTSKVNLIVYDDQKNVLHTGLGKSYEKATLNISRNTTVGLCFSKMKELAGVETMVFVDFRTIEEETLHKGDSEDDLNNVGRLVSNFHEIRWYLNEYESELSRLKSSIKNHEVSRAKFYSQVTYWSIFQCAVIIFVGMSQVYLIQNLFYQKAYV